MDRAGKIVHARNAKDFEALLRAGRWFGGLPAEFQRDLLGAGVVRNLRKGEWLFSRGDVPSGLYAVLDGGIRITATAPSGKEVLLALVEPPMWFGEIAVFDGLPRTHDAVAAEKSVALHVPASDLDGILAREPRYWRDLGLLIASKLRLTFLAMEDSAVLPIADRLARRLLMSVERYGEWHDRTSRVVDLRQQQLATMLSTSRQTVNQLLKDLEGQGIVRLSYRHIEILDLDGLRRVALSGAPAPLSRAVKKGSR
ncbi:MAG TPA: Crp/Fnr family transcriptional regulator [Polyangiaceae bacterium]|jgi:CRP/FNR family transcriptional regulator, cyclic AMP receptor protein|nr:Crp/Fnr family transcriptional regulator [Polyangiaceae bacterium]